MVRPLPVTRSLTRARTGLVLGVLLAVLSLMLSGCSSSSSGQASPAGSPASSAASNAATTAPDSFPKDVSVNGQPVHLDAKPTKIVILGPSLTETAFGVGAGAQVTAVDKLSNYPADAPTSDLDAFKPNAEAVAAKSPDLVLVSNDANNLVSSLSALKIPVALLPAPATVDDAYAQFVTVGELTGNTEAAQKLVETSKQTIADAVSKAPASTKGTSYYWELDPTFYSVTSQTFVGSVLSDFGLVNIADKAPKAAGGYPQLSEEFIIDADPDLIFLADTVCCQVNADAVAKRKGWDVTRAVKDADGIVEVNDDIASRWGPRFPQIAVAASEALQKIG